MFEQIQSRLNKVLTNIRGEGKITESNIDSALRDVRRALLEADVNYKVVKSFISRVKEQSKGKKVFGKCKACHKLGDGENGTGPNLYQIVGRQMASVTEFKYSGSFKGLEGQWTKDELNQFLTKPSNYIPGTSMSFAGLGKVTDRANLIAYLEESAN